MTWYAIGRWYVNFLGIGHTIFRSMCSRGPGIASGIARTADGEYITACVKLNTPPTNCQCSPPS